MGTCFLSALRCAFDLSLPLLLLLLLRFLIAAGPCISLPHGEVSPLMGGLSDSFHIKQIELTCNGQVFIAWNRYSPLGQVASIHPSLIGSAQSSQTVQRLAGPGFWDA